MHGYTHLANVDCDYRPSVRLLSNSYQLFLIKNSKKGLRNKVTLGMFIAIATMYIVSLTHFLAIVHAAFTVVGDVWTGTTTHLTWFGLPRYVRWAALVEGSAVLVNAVLNDGIVMWRAWIIWDRSREVLAISTVLSLATLATGIWSVRTAGGIASGAQDVGVTH
ncbi:hypothetical protein BC834DRAFT_699832 [Gloeopeniophorella convolvens]|nr:hypothetical protein BC834DRAFT_699832 [Gloeopeniophorella convolvens]